MWLDATKGRFLSRKTIFAVFADIAMDVSHGVVLDVVDVETTVLASQIVRNGLGERLLRDRSLSNKKMRTRIVSSLRLS